MNRGLLRNVAAILIGLVLGAGLNMTIILLGPSIIPAPAGVDVSDIESIRASIDQYKLIHFVPVFLAHALGTLVGALLAFLIAASYQNIMAYLIGVAFLAGGIAASFMIPAPVWFIVTDIVVAYIPMAWLGIQLGQRLKARNRNE